jgi:glycosyltransferase involved in cell wall biosynthesis
MIERPLVSVIVIFLNAERFIEEAIESVFAQSYDHWELLLIDDGSTDRSTEIAQNYARKYPGKVRYIEHAGHQNHGAAASRNVGIRHSQGKYIALLDSDDVWLPHKLEKQVTILESHPETGMTFGTSHYWYSWTGNPEDAGRDYMPAFSFEPDVLIMPPNLMTLCYPLGKSPAPCPSDLVLRRDLAESIGGFEESFTGVYQLYEDQAFLTKVYLRAPVYVTGGCWDKYRIHPDSCVSTVTKAGLYNSIRLRFLNWLENYLTEQGIDDAGVWLALQRELRSAHYYASFRYRVIDQSISRMKEWIKTAARRALPSPAHQSLRSYWHRYRQSRQSENSY